MKSPVVCALISLLVVGTSQVHALTSPVIYMQTVVPAVPVETLNITQIPAGNDANVRFDVVVSGTPAAVPSGTVTLTLIVDGEAPTINSSVLIGGKTSWSVTKPQGSFTVQASYSGDVNYQAQTVSRSDAGNTPSSDFDFSSSVIRVRQGETWTGTIQVLRSNGFAQSLSLTCSTPIELQCTVPTTTPSVSQASGSNKSQSIPLSIKAYPGQFVVSSILILPIIFGMYRRQCRRFVMCLAPLLLLGCATESSVGWQKITPKGTYHVTVTGVSSSLQHARDLTVIVE